MGESSPTHCSTSPMEQVPAKGPAYPFPGEGITKQTARNPKELHREGD